jgi:hypothetical protein
MAGHGRRKAEGAKGGRTEKEMGGKLATILNRVLRGCGWRQSIRPFGSLVPSFTSSLLALHSLSRVRRRLAGAVRACD